MADEEIQVSTPETVETETETSTQEPAETAETSDTAESEVETEEAENEETPEWFKKDKYKTVEEQAKAYSEAEKKLTEYSQKIKEIEKQTQEQQFTQQQKQVEQGTQQLDLMRDGYINNYKNIKTQLRAEALAAYEENGNYQEYMATLERYDAQFDEAIADVNRRYEFDKQNLTKRNHELTSQRISNTFKDFETQNAKRLENPADRALFDAFKEKGYDPQELNAVFELADLYMQATTKNANAKKQISSDIDADKSAMTSTMSKNHTSSLKPTSAEDLEKMTDAEYKQYLKKNKYI